MSIISYFSSLTIRFSNAYVFLYYFNELHSVVLCTILMNYIVLHAWNYSEVCSVLFCQSTLMSNKKQTWTWSLDWTLRGGGYYIRKNTLTIRSMSFSGERQKNLFFFLTEREESARLKPHVGKWGEGGLLKNRTECLTLRPVHSQQGWMLLRLRLGQNLESRGRRCLTSLVNRHFVPIDPWN